MLHFVARLAMTSYGKSAEHHNHSPSLRGMKCNGMTKQSVYNIERLAHRTMAETNKKAQVAKIGPALFETYRLILFLHKLHRLSSYPQQVQAAV